MWPFKSKPKHDWYVVRVVRGYGLFHTTASEIYWRCRSCPKTQMENREGHWYESDFQ